MRFAAAFVLAATVAGQSPAPPDGSGDCRLEDVENEIR